MRNCCDDPVNCIIVAVFFWFLLVKHPWFWTDPCWYTMLGWFCAETDSLSRWNGWTFPVWPWVYEIYIPTGGDLSMGIVDWFIDWCIYSLIHVLCWRPQCALHSWNEMECLKLTHPRLTKTGRPKNALAETWLRRTIKEQEGSLLLGTWHRIPCCFVTCTRPRNSLLHFYR